MSYKVKAGVLVVITFFLGVMVGVIGHRTWVHAHFKRIAAFKNHPTMIDMVLTRIDPTDEQLPKVRDLLIKHDIQFAELRKRHHMEISGLLNTLRVELDPLLTPEQIARMNTPPPPPPLHGFKSGPFPPPPEGAQVEKKMSTQ